MQAIEYTVAATQFKTYAEFHFGALNEQAQAVSKARRGPEKWVFQKHETILPSEKGPHTPELFSQGLIKHKRTFPICRISAAGKTDRKRR